METGRKTNLIMLLLIIAIIGCIFLIYYLKDEANGQEEIMKCIAEKSHLYGSRTCSVCAQQKILLGEYIKYFNMTDCFLETQKCAEKGITDWPAWEINNQLYIGLKSIEKLKELARC